MMISHRRDAPTVHRLWRQLDLSASERGLVGHSPSPSRRGYSVDEYRRSRTTVVERTLQDASDRDRATPVELLRAVGQASEAPDTSALRES